MPQDDHQPTLGEVYRLLLAVQASIQQMTTDARADRQHAAETYVRKDVLDAKLTAIGDDIKELQGDRDTQQDRNRQIIIGVITGFIVIVIGVIATALGLPTGGGGV